MKMARSMGVIFDMDGVLVDSARAHFKSWRLLAEECGTTVTDEQFSATFGRHNGDIIPFLFGAVSGARLSELADRKETIYRDLIRAAPPLVEGAAGLLDGLHASGVRLAVGSSGPPANIRLVLEALGAIDKIDVIVSGDDVERGKPDPEVFRLACDQLDLPATDCVVIEDAPVGIQAARAAGAKTVAVLIYHPVEAFDGPDKTVRSLGELDVGALISLVDRQD